MPIELHPMKEEDVAAHTDIMWGAFEHDLMSVFYPNGMSKKDRDSLSADTLKTLRKNSDDILLIKAIDTDLPAEKQIVSTAKWIIHPRQRTEEELKKEEEEAQKEEFSEGANKEAMIAFFGELAAKRREIFGGDPYMLLSLLVVHPDHQRRGLGATQLKLGLEKADELGIQAYLESSPKGKGLYAKYGFEEKELMKFDARDFGRHENVVHTLMVRPAKTK